MVVNKFEKTINDFVDAAKLVNAPANRGKLEDVFRVFGDDILAHTTQFRVTNKKNVELNFRTLSPVDRSARIYDRCVKEGLIADGDEPVYKVYSELENKLSGYDSVRAIDFDADFGLAKLWYIMSSTSLIHPKDLVKFENCPKALFSLLETFEKLQLDQIVIFGVDYQKKSFNIYFKVPKPYHSTTQFVEDYLKAFNFEVPAQPVLEFCSRVLCLALTVTWDSPKVQRVCFYYPEPSLEKVKAAFGPGTLYDFAVKAPTLKEHPLYIISQSLGPKLSDAYNKLETEYTGDIGAIFMNVMRG